MKVAVVGYGRMGRAVDTVAGERGHTVVARVNGSGALHSALDTPSPLAGAEVAVEFTTPEAAPEVIIALARAGIPVVSGTTGWEPRREEVEGVVQEEASRGAALLHSPNFAPGVHLFFRLVRAAAGLLEGMEEMDVHLMEVHHRHKADHPSGTARRLAEILVEEISRKSWWEEGPGDAPADPARLQLSSVRAGENPGAHILGIEGPDDRIELRHEARGRSGFARGAVQAAEWLRGREGVHQVDAWLQDYFGSGTAG